MRPRHHRFSRRFHGGSLLLILAVVGVVAHAAVTTGPKFLQRRFGRITTGTAVTASFRRANKAGDLIVAHVVWDNGGAVSLTDSRGNTYASA
ncbi:MAG: hypothetical protein ACHQNA_14105, partial [Acidimicrobiales bacterium]